MLFERFENSCENIRLFGMFVAVLILHSLYSVYRIISHGRKMINPFVSIFRLCNE